MKNDTAEHHSHHIGSTWSFLKVVFTLFQRIPEHFVWLKARPMEYMANEQKQQDEYMFYQRLTTCVLRTCTFFSTVIQSVNKMLFVRNIKAISSANFIFFISLNLHCWQKFLSSASNHCINKFCFVNHDLACLQMHFKIFCSILQEEHLSQCLHLNIESKWRGKVKVVSGLFI